MSDEIAWFSAKRFGYGCAMPISWQGWGVTLAYAVAILGTAHMFAKRPEILVPLMAVATIIFLVVAMRTTKGGWRWRSGEDA